MLHNNLDPNYVYLFLIDLIRTNYDEYMKLEPGYDSSMLYAYIAAFNMPKDGKMSEELFKVTQREAMAFNPYKESGGEYSKTAPRIGLVLPFDTHEGNDNYNICYNATPEGISEFVDYWMRNNSSEFHSCVEFVPHAEGLKDRDFFLTKPEYPGYIIAEKVNQEDNGSQLTAITPEYAAAIISVLSAASNFTIYIHPLYTVALPNAIPENAVLIKQRKMQEIIKSFNDQIVNATSSKEKIRLIAQHAILVDQTHPFPDGNVRTIYIVINKLLRDHDLPLTLLLNPNRLDFCSIDQVVDMIERGQIFYQQTLQHKDGDLVFKMTDGIFGYAINNPPKNTTYANEHLELEVTNGIYNYTINCPPQSIAHIDKDLVQKFIDCVIKGNADPNYSMTRSSSNLFYKKPGQPTVTLSQLIISSLNADQVDNPDLFAAIKAEDFNLALSLACSTEKIAGINTLLSYNKHIHFDIENIQLPNGKNIFEGMDDNKKLSNKDKILLKEQLTGYISENKMGSSRNI